MKFLPLSLTTVLSLCLTVSCISQEEIDAANKIITAMPTEVTGCTFVGDVDVNPHATMGNARFDMKRMAAAMGATHVVEINAFCAPIGAFPYFGYALTGRVYWCPEGLGPKVAVPEANLETPVNTLYRYDNSRD